MYIVAFYSSLSFIPGLGDDDLIHLLRENKTISNTEEIAIFCNIEVLKGRFNRVESYLNDLEDGERSDVCWNMVFFDSAYHNGSVAKKLIKTYEDDESVLEAAVKAAAAGQNYELAMQLISESNAPPLKVNQLAESVCEMAVIHGDANKYNSSFFFLEQSDFDFITTNPQLLNKAAKQKFHEQEAAKEGLDDNWKELLIPYDLELPDETVPTSIEELEKRLAAFDQVEQRFTLRFKLAAHCLSAGEKAQAQSQYDELMQEARAEDKLLQKKLDLLCFLAAKLDDRAFIQDMALRQDLLEQIRKPKRQGLAVIAAACELGMHKEVFDCISTIDSPKFSLIKTIGSFGTLEKSAYWEKLNETTRIRVTAFRHWKSILKNP